MNAVTKEELLKAALNLADDERARLADQVSMTLANELPEVLDAEWSREIARRIEEIDNGTAVLRNANDVMREARNSLKP